MSEEGDYLEIHESDLLKVRSALRDAHKYLAAINEANAALHRDDPVYSPLTVAVKQAHGRVTALLEGHNSVRREKEEE